MLEADGKYSCSVSYKSAYRLRSLNRTVMKSLSFTVLLLVSLINAHYTRKRVIKIINKKKHTTIKLKVGEKY